MTRFALTGTVLDSPDPKGLALFQERLLGWPLGSDEPEWATLRPAGGGAGLSFQPQDDVRVCLDPAGHPFCLFLPGW